MVVIELSVFQHRIRWAHDDLAEITQPCDQSIRQADPQIVVPAPCIQLPERKHRQSFESRAGLGRLRLARKVKQHEGSGYSNDKDDQEQRGSYLAALDVVDQTESARSHLSPRFLDHAHPRQCAVACRFLPGGDLRGALHLRIKLKPLLELTKIDLQDFDCLIALLSLLAQRLTDDPLQLAWHCR